MKKFLSAIERFNLKKKVLIAFSGGSDSMFLLMMFLKAGYAVELAYVNHLLRGEESDEEERFVKRVAEDLGLKLHMIRVDIKKIATEEKIGTEEAARKARYAFFDSLRGKVATAHHLDDNVETFIFRLLRGTSMRGLRGIPSVRGKYIRPLLDFSKGEILKYLDKNKIEYVKDSSNYKTDFTRNKIRLELFPIFEKINPKFREKVANLISDFNQLEEDYSQSRVDEMIFGLLDGEMSRNKVNSARKLMSKNGSAYMDLSKEKILKKIKDRLVVERRETFSEETKKLLLGEVITFFGKQLIAEEVAEISDKGANVFYANTGDLYVRQRKDGDFFYPKGLGRKKKLKNFLIDMKVDRFERDKLPIVCSGDEIVWVAGLRGSERFAANGSSKQIVKLTLVEPTKK